MGGRRDSPGDDCDHIAVPLDDQLNPCQTSPGERHVDHSATETWYETYDHILQKDQVEDDSPELLKKLQDQKHCGLCPLVLHTSAHPEVD